MAEALASYGGELPSAWVQATGPSRTADIELTLSIGVHGPGVVHVVLLSSS
jgi:L-lactate dehydrogenase complex protein LldG